MLPHFSPHTHTSPFKYLTVDESAAIKMSAERFRNEMGEIKEFPWVINGAMN